MRLTSRAGVKVAHFSTDQNVPRVVRLKCDYISLKLEAKNFKVGRAGYVFYFCSGEVFRHVVVMTTCKAVASSEFSWPDAEGIVRKRAIRYTAAESVWEDEIVGVVIGWQSVRSWCAISAESSDWVKHGRIRNSASLANKIMGHNML